MLSEDLVLTVAHGLNEGPPGVFTCPTTRVELNEIEVYQGATGEMRVAGSCRIPFPNQQGALGATDVALITLESPFSASHEVMILSDASNSALEAELARVLGYPKHIDTTGTCALSPNMVRSPGANVLDVTTHPPLSTGEVRTQNDNSGGQSGGPIYYCPSNPTNGCDTGESTYVFGVTSGVVSLGPSSYNLGAKIPGFVHDYIHVLYPNLP